MNSNNLQNIINIAEQTAVIINTDQKSTINTDMGSIDNTIEYNLDTNNLDKYGITFEKSSDILILSTSNDFNYNVFNHIGFVGDFTTNISLDSAKYLTSKFSTFPINDKLALIDIYFKLETLRWINTKLHKFLLNRSSLTHTIYILIVIFNIIIYVIQLVDTQFTSTSQYIKIATPALIFINYLLSRIIAVSSLNQSTYNTLQKQFTKLRLYVEIIILGNDNSLDTISNKINKINKDINDLNHLSTITNNTELNNIYTSAISILNKTNDDINEKIKNLISITSNI